MVLAQDRHFMTGASIISLFKSIAKSSGQHSIRVPITHCEKLPRRHSLEDTIVTAADLAR